MESSNFNVCTHRNRIAEISITGTNEQDLYSHAANAGHLAASHIMKSKTIYIVLAIAVVGAFLAGRFLAPSVEHTHTEASDSATNPTTWTCSMHPQIQQPAPGLCPICGMELIPLSDDSDSHQNPRTLTMSEHAKALAEVETTEVVRGYPDVPVRLVGKLDYDETREKSLTARFPARIEKLFVNYTGIPVQAGEHLALIYSPELLSAQRELLTAYKNSPDGPITAIAREKLRLWDLLPDQIDAIINQGNATDRFELRAPIGGVVVAKEVNEGDYINTGDPLFRIVDLSQLWLTLDAYESDLPWLRYGQSVEFKTEAYPGITFEGKISFIEPELDRKTRTVAVRVNVQNTDGRLKPGMLAHGIVHSRIGENGQVYAPDFEGKWICPMHPEIIKDTEDQCDLCGMDLVPAEELGYVHGKSEAAPVLVPASAVLRTGKRAVVYVEIPNTNRPTFEGREIVLGPKAGDVFIVESGLNAGEFVVTNGAFKIDSALQIQAKPSMMSASSGKDDGMMNTGPAMDMGTMPKPENKGAIIELLPEYFELQAALATDDLETAQAAIDKMSETTNTKDELGSLIQALQSADSLNAIRSPHFKTLSDKLISAIGANPSVTSTTVYRMFCPMAGNGSGADWLQDNESLKNPYFGPAMQQCGEVKGKIN